MPAVVRRIDDEHAVALALIENIQREDLNPLEEALALSRLITRIRLTHQQAAEAVGRSRAAVSNLLRLLELPQAIRPFIEKRELEMGHARALLALPAAPQQAEVGALVAKKGLSVRETEALVRRLHRARRAEARASPARRARRTRTSSGSRTTSPTSSARRSSCSTRRRARASSSSAITASTSSTESSRTSVDGKEIHGNAPNCAAAHAVAASLAFFAIARLGPDSP